MRTIQRRSKWFDPPKRPQRLRRPLIAHGHSTSTHTTNDQTSREESKRPSHRNRLPGNGRSEICCHTPNRPMSGLTLHRPTQTDVPWLPTSRPPKQNNAKQNQTSRLFPAGESPTATRQPEAKPKISRNGRIASTTTTSLHTTSFRPAPVRYFFSYLIYILTPTYILLSMGLRKWVQGLGILGEQKMVTETDQNKQCQTH